MCISYYRGPDSKDREVIMFGDDAGTDNSGAAGQGRGVLPAAFMLALGAAGGLML